MDFHHITVGDYNVAVIDNFYTQEEHDMILQECLFFANRDKLQAPGETHAAKGVDNNFLKKANGIFLDKVFSERNISDILTFNRKVFSLEVFNELQKIDSVYNYIKVSNKDESLLNYYENGDYYKSHLDLSTITCISMFHKTPKAFTGGGLFFEFDEKKMVECVTNRVVLFPSFLFHAVESVQLDEDKVGKGLGRFTVTQFIKTQ